MYEKAKNLNNNSILVNNGNDYETLAKNDLLNIQNELSNINKPIIGYLGGIRNWIDFDLLEYLINEIKEAHFVFISLVYRNAKPNFIKLLSHKNVTWIKYKQQNELPSYLRKFNVGLIPFKINKFMDGVFPNKFFEYMACEVPIVTTALPELEKYSQIIGFSQTRQDFLKNCKMAINGNFDEKVKFYSELAKINSWSNKAEYINTHIKNILNI
jgi:glycosyltransferase involved in cell wall biosynthesis